MVLLSSVDFPFMLGYQNWFKALGQLGIEIISLISLS